MRRSETKAYWNQRRKLERTREFKDYRNNRDYLKKLLKELEEAIKKNYLSKETLRLLEFCLNQAQKVEKLREIVIKPTKKQKQKAKDSILTDKEGDFILFTTKLGVIQGF